MVVVVVGGGGRTILSPAPHAVCEEQGEEVEVPPALFLSGGKPLVHSLLSLPHAPPCQERREFERCVTTVEKEEGKGEGQIAKLKTNKNQKKGLCLPC